MWSATRGATLLIPSGPPHDPDRMHLHIVLTNPLVTTGDVLLVCVCSIPQSNLYDGSCTLFPGEHPFVVKHSFVDYNRCAIANAQALELKVINKVFFGKPSLNAKRIEDVLVGFVESPRVAPKFKRFFSAAP